MKYAKEVAVLLAAAALAASAVMPLAGASEIYKWTDAEGNVHYGDRPSGVASEERVAIASQRTDAARVQAGIDARLERQATRDEARQARETEDAERAEEEKKSAERAAACEENRQRLNTFDEAARLYREDENGERVYLDESEREAAKQRARELINEHCG